MEEIESYEDKLRDIFDFYDEDHDGYIAVDHVQSVLTKEQFGVAQPQVCWHSKQSTIYRFRCTHTYSRNLCLFRYKHNKRDR